MEDIWLDENGNFVVAANGDIATVAGINCLVQDICHRLMTYRGDLWLHQSYGSELQLYTQAEDTDLNRLELAQEIRLTLMQEEKINPESIKVEVTGWAREAIYLMAVFTPAEDYSDDESDGETAAQAAIEIKITQGNIEVTGL